LSKEKLGEDEERGRGIVKREKFVKAIFILLCIWFFFISLVFPILEAQSFTQQQKNKRWVGGCGGLEMEEREVFRKLNTL
jgi:hypothetical protein